MSNEAEREALIFHELWYLRHWLNWIEASELKKQHPAVKNKELLRGLIPNID